MKSSLTWALIFIGASFLHYDLAAQSADSVSVLDGIRDLEKKNNVQFFYRADWIRNLKVTKNSASALNDFLSFLAKNANISQSTLNNGKYIFLYRGPAPTMDFIRQQTDSAETAAVKVESNSTVILSGVIEDGKTGELIIGANVFIEELGTGTSSDMRGFYSIKVPSGVVTVRVSAVGKLPTQQKLDIQNNLRLNFEMFEDPIELENVVVTAEGLNRNVTSGEMSQVKIDVKTLKSISPFMGEIDVVKSILLLPGVSTVGEGSSGFNVRGGNVDQNLVLLDNVPLFNSSHLFGFFSTFNPDFIKDVVLYKGGMPAQFGGRISSVLDVKMREGNPNKITASGGLGIISSRLLLEGPLSRKTTFMIGGRGAYPNWLLKKTPDLNVSKSSAYFYDLNARVQHKFNDRNTLLLTAYRSADHFKFAADTTYGWSTTNLTAKWTTVINEHLFANVNIASSKYDNQIRGVREQKQFTANFGVNTQLGNVDFTYMPAPKHKIDFGASATRYTFNPGKLVPNDDSTIPEKTINDEYSIEQGYFITEEWKPNETFLVTAGLRHSRYSVLGQGKVFVYDPDRAMDPSSIVDTLNFKKGQAIANYSGWEPRLAVKISLGDQSSIKLSYNRNLQYVQLISNTTAISPLDLWRSSNYYIKPAIGNQVAVGYFQNFADNKVEFSVETYYKLIENLVEYKNGASLFMNPFLESQLLKAEGKMYGAEFFLRKNTGKLTGWIAYTYSRTFRRTVDVADEDMINEGKYYPSNYDKPNYLAIAANYAFTRRVNASANFTYSTGRPI
ncbi:MAG TPA: TonB-dependent receptor, partial [Cyclobacteriaceae bacterium]